MPAQLLTLNAGSSSVKFALFDAPQPGRQTAQDLPVASWVGQAEGLGAALQARVRVRDASGALVHDAPLDGADSTHAGALAALLQWRRQHLGDTPLAAVGHRIVHGGPRFTHPLHIDAALLADLTALEPLAPLHQPHNLAGVRAAMRAFADVPQIACFDTAFHATQHSVNQRFALPGRWFDDGVRRYGFHGLSYESIVAQFACVDPALAQQRVVVAHLGNGASMCAVAQGRSVATTMSFSPLDGLTMGTRCGQIDAAVVLYLQQAHGMSTQAVTQLLFRESGLLGISGISSDMRVLEASAQPAAALAIDHFVEQVVQQLGRMVAALRGVDALVFTGGIGENALALRARILAQCAWLGVDTDVQATRPGTGRISSAGSAVAAWVLRTDEEAVIARHALRLLHAARG